MKERPILFSTSMVQAILEGRKTMTRRVVKYKPHKDHIYCDGNGIAQKCPYGSVGDRLWVRETWAYRQWNHDRVYYKADNNLADINREDEKWRPSIFMPRKLSRITLEITNIRVERLQEITESDAISEGIIHNSMNDPKIEFQWLWQSINGIESWEANPFIWVIEFKRV